MIDIKPLVTSNFSDFIFLLRLRSEVSEDYYRWKYLQQPITNSPVGFIAYSNNQPVGCIGIINKTFCCNENSYPATWFADWFVHAEFRTSGVGNQLLSRVAGLTNYSFGTPAPPKARLLTTQLYKNALYYTKTKCIINPFRYGLHVYQDFLFKRMLRALKYGLGNFSSRGGKRDGTSFQIGLPDSDAWKLITSTKNSVFFFHDVQTLNWFSDLRKLNPNISFWNVQNEEVFIFGILEQKQSGLKVGKVLDYKIPENLKIADLVQETVRGREIDVVEYYSLTENAESKYDSVLYSTVPIEQNFRLTSFDKESDWSSLT